MLHDSCWSLDGHDDCSVGFGSGSSFKRISLSLSYLSLTALSVPNGAPTIAAATGFLPAFYVGDRESLITLPRRAALIPVRWAAAGALRVAAEAGPDEAEKKKRQRGITKPRPVSPQLQAVVGEVEIPRTQALKKIWAYIKENNLQDRDDKRIIVCDEKLQNIFGKDRVGFLEISGLLNPHFRK